MAVANRLQRAFEEPFPLGEHDVLIGASIGIAVYSDSVCDSSELLKCADIAMYRAKKVGRNQIQFYSEELAREVRFRNRIEMGLRTRWSGMNSGSFIRGNSMRFPASCWEWRPCCAGNIRKMACWRRTVSCR